MFIEFHQFVIKLGNSSVTGSEKGITHRPYTRTSEKGYLINRHYLPIYGYI